MFRVEKKKGKKRIRKSSTGRMDMSNGERNWRVGLRKDQGDEKKGKLKRKMQRCFRLKRTEGK